MPQKLNNWLRNNRLVRKIFGPPISVEEWYIAEFFHGVPMKRLDALDHNQPFKNAQVMARSLVKRINELNEPISPKTN